jgi:hypothetical protein
MLSCGCVVGFNAAMMLVQCFSGVGSVAGTLLAAMWLRCVDVVVTVLVSPTQSRFLQTLTPFIAKQHYKINYNPIHSFAAR